jgi:hypothetical protein
MRILLSLLLLSLTFLSAVTAQDADDAQKTKFDYQVSTSALHIARTFPAQSDAYRVTLLVYVGS